LGAPQGKRRVGTQKKNIPETETKHIGYATCVDRWGGRGETYEKRGEGKAATGMGKDAQGRGAGCRAAGEKEKT